MQGTSVLTTVLTFQAMDLEPVELAVDLPCRGYDADLWFAERTSEVELAKALCKQCPLTSQCLAGALERGEPWGVWGGEVLVAGQVVATKRGRGRPRKEDAA